MATNQMPNFECGPEPKEIVLYNRDVEEAVISYLLMDPQKFIEIEIEAKWFYIHKHQWIIEAYQRIFGRNEIPDFTVLVDELDQIGQLAEIGGPAFLTTLVNFYFVSSLQIEANIQIIRNYWLRRKFVDKARWMAERAVNLQTDLGEIQDTVITELSNIQTSGKRSRHISAVVSDVYDDAEEQSKNPAEVWGIPSGFIDLDNFLGGAQPQESIYVAGEPGIGKSIFANQWGIQSATSENGVWLCSLEMKDKRLVQRVLSAYAQVYTRSIKTGYIDSEEWQRFTDACELTSKKNVHVWDHAGLTLSQFRAEAARLKTHGMKLVVLDYLYLLAGYDNLDMIPRTEILSRGVQQIARQLDIAIITVNSVTKEGMGGFSASNTQIRGSGQMIHEADVIAFLKKYKINMNGNEKELNQKDFATANDLRIRSLEFTKVRDGDMGDDHKILFGLTQGYPKFVDLIPPEKKTPPNGKQMQWIHE